MDFNWIVYPAPKPKYDINYFLKNPDPQQQKILILIDHIDEIKYSRTQIPCIYLENQNNQTDYTDQEQSIQFQQNQQINQEESHNNNKLIIYFHGNAEDLIESLVFLRNLENYYQCSVISMEYPGYGFFSHQITNNEPDFSKPLFCNNQELKSCSNSFIKHIIKSQQRGGLGFKKENITIFGRSMGSGPSCYLAQQYKPQALILMSAFTSIKDVAYNLVGSISYFVNDHFNNLESMKNIKCPVLLIHGEDDQLIPCSHSSKLYDALLSQIENDMALQPNQSKSNNDSNEHLQYSCLFIQRNMTHNNFILETDILHPIKQFLHSLIPLYHLKKQVTD